MSKHPKKKSGYSPISKKLLSQCTLWVAGYIVGLLLLYLLGWQICRGLPWQRDSSLFLFLKKVQNTAFLWGGLLIAAGVILIARRFIAKALGFVDEIVDASARLACRPEEMITLSPPMKSIQDELNLVRERTLNDARALRETEQRKNDLIIYLAHDLKTPLTSVVGYLTLLRDDGGLSPELRSKYTGIALNKAERLEELIGEFFDITRFNLTDLSLEKKTINLTRMLEQISFEFRPILSERSLRCELQLEPNLRLQCDPEKLERVFDNVFRNAVIYSYPGSPIEVTLARRGKNAVVQICNHGKTIPPDKLSHIFEQFFRLDDSRSSSTGGAGLGLAIAKEIVELHGGAISAESAAERICFTVTLPLPQ